MIRNQPSPPSLLPTTTDPAKCQKESRVADAGGVEVETVEGWGVISDYGDGKLEAARTRLWLPPKLMGAHLSPAFF